MNTHHRIDRRVKGSARVHRRVGAGLAAAAVAAVMLVPGAQAAVPREHAASSEEYVPFVTDFARSEPTTATEEPFVPFVSDFPKTTVAPGGAADSAGGIDWDEAAVAVGLGGGVAALLAGSGVILFRRARPVGS